MKLTDRMKRILILKMRVKEGTSNIRLKCNIDRKNLKLMKLLKDIKEN
jgi:hypothetical protein